MMDVSLGIPRDHIPNIAGHHGVCEFLREHYDMEVNPTYVRDQCVAGKISYYIIGGKRHFSEKEILDWLMTHPRKVPRSRRLPKSEAAN